MKKINISELLKNCPIGMELDSTIIDKLYFGEVTEHMIKCYTKQYSESACTCNTIYFHHDGTYLNTPNAKCVIFPKGKTTWEGFQRPFKDGDILFIEATFNWILIYKDSENKEAIYKYAAMPTHSNDNFITHDNNSLCHEKDISNIRFATEEEKQKLFDAIKANGYKWNPETKTLEDLIVPKFKVGDQIVKRNSINNSWIISSVSSEYYGLTLPGSEGIGVLPISEQDNYELISTVPKFKVGDRIKSKINQVVYTITDVRENAYIIYEKIDKFGYHVPFCAEKNYELVTNKFDINTLKPFESRVLVRTNNGKCFSKWVSAFYSHYDKDHTLHYCVVGGLYYEQCIPFEGNEHLLNTTDECDEYYKNW